MLVSGSCEKQLHPLSKTRTPYADNELRIDGYYYSDPTSANDRGVAIFYANGICIHNFTRIQSKDTFDYIENHILRNTTLISSMLTTPTHIGVFHINDSTLEFETWESAYDITTFSHFAEIKNDTTFLLLKRVDNESNRTVDEKLTYRFRQFSPKPDSTTSFIE